MRPKRKPLVQVVDDEDDIRSSLRMILEYEGMEMMEAASGPDALAQLATAEPDVVLLDIKMPRMDGLEALAEIRKRRPSVPVIMISGHGTIATAVEATKRGAFDFLEKPLESEQVLLRIRKALEHRQIVDRYEALKDSVEARHRMLGESTGLERVREAVARCAPTRASVLITGESGTGKELVARAIHRNSPRAEGPFVKVNCAAIPDELIESELFGHVKGSFTGAVKDQEGKFVQADGGTIFLDEIGDMSLKTQAKVLRVLQDGEVEPVGAAKTIEVDVRVIAATNKDLAEEIAGARFREDLYFRLNVVPITLPPLRERTEDVAELVAHFVESFCRENDYKRKAFSPEALDVLAGLPWRGNVRELRNAVERLMIMTRGDTIEAKDIPAGLGMALETTATPRAARGTLVIPYDGLSLQQFKDASERSFLVARLQEHSWNVAETSRAIDTPRSNLYKKLEAYGIDREKDG
jgi:two-component system nitrogen regulation response regulator NtrX